jgi:hypothetical protein
MRMSVEVVGPVINRSADEVLDFFTNFENSPLYGRTITTVRQGDQPTSVGTVFDEETKIMGRTMSLKTEVIGFERPSMFSYRATFENGMIEQAQFKFETVEGGAQMNGSAQVEIPMVPQFLASFFAWQMKRQVRPLLENLKKAIETT